MTFRCAECGDGSHLSACAAATVVGPLAADGTELLAHDDVTEAYVHEDSIQCDLHPAAPVDEWRDGAWHRWVLCASCDGAGEVRSRHGYMEKCRECGGTRRRELVVAS